jgi:hypothetical protein
MSAYTAPGVYVEELPSGSRAISGVSTSLTAFVGQARRGPVDQPTRIFGFAEFEREFGGLWTRSPMSQALRQYFSNGGSEALIVRAVNRGTTNPARKASTILAAASSRMLVQASAAAQALPSFDHLALKVTATGGMGFDLEVSACNAAGAVLKDGSNVDYKYTVSLTAGSPVAATMAAKTTITTPPINLATLANDAAGNPTTPSAVPDAGTVTTARTSTGLHFATLSSTTGMILKATTTAKALTGFDHLELGVSNVVGLTFALTISACDSVGALVEAGVGIPATYTVQIDLAGNDAAVAAAIAAGQTSNAVKLATLVGSKMPIAPTAGSYVSVAVATDHVARLVVGLRLDAPSEGAWGNALRASVSILDALPGAFHLTLEEVDGGGKVLDAEAHFNVSTNASDPRALDQLLARESKLARLVSGMGGSAAAATSALAMHSGRDGDDVRISDLVGSEAGKTGIHALLDADIFNLLCIPLTSWQTSVSEHVDMWTQAEALCVRKRAFLLIDPPSNWVDFALASAAAPTLTFRNTNAALYYPSIKAADPLQEGRLREFPPCGVLAGVIARTDGARGVWKAPAGTDAYLLGVPELTVKLNDGQQGVLNQLGINCLRSFPVYGTLVWGARTLVGADALASEWKYLPVRRLTLYLEESLQRGLQWAVFEPNDEPLWAQIRQTIKGFMQGLYRQGAFQGRSAREAYFIKCDRETTTQADRDRGVVNVVIGFAPVRPAEFVVIKLQQLAGQAAV